MIKSLYTASEHNGTQKSKKAAARQPLLTPPGFGRRFLFPFIPLAMISDILFAVIPGRA